MSSHDELSPLAYALQAVIERNREEAKKEAEKRRPPLPRISYYFVVFETLDGIRTEPAPWGHEHPGHAMVRPIPTQVRFEQGPVLEAEQRLVRRYALRGIRRRSDGHTADAIYREVSP